jgi:hypothetical protein
MPKSDRSTKNHKVVNSNKTLYDRLSNWLEANTKWWVLGVLIIGLAVGVLTFDVKPSTGGDDTGYVLQAMDINSTGHLPIGFRTPGYPMVLAIFVWIFGVNLVILKTTSLLFFLGLIGSLFFVFHNRLQTMILYPVLLLVAINPLIIEYSHQTYSELLFALLIVWAIHYLLCANDKESIRFTILAAVLTMMSFYIRIAGATVAVSAVIFFAWHRQWKQLGMFILICVLLYSPLKFYEWTSDTAAFGQATGYFLKNYYNPTQGMETLSGFVERFINNIINHLSYQFPSAVGIPIPAEYSLADGRLIPSISAFFGILISTVLLTGFITPMLINRKSTISFLGIFVMVYVSFISIALQNQISTIRMLVPIIPYLFFGIFEGCRWLGNRWVKVTDSETVSTRAKTLMLIACFVLLFVGVMGTKKSVAENYPILEANLSGNKLAGFSEDWVNYLRASLWIKDQLPLQTTGIICRKPELFLLYAGHYSVYGAYKIDQTNPDSIVAKWKAMNMTHLLYDSFQWSSTLRRYVQPVAEKYPQIFVLIHQEGSQLPSYVFRLNYDAMNNLMPRKK